MTSPKNLEKRLDDLEHGTGQSMPKWFMAWGQDAGATDDEIRAAWKDVVEATGEGDPMGAVWKWDLQGKSLFGK